MILEPVVLSQYAAELLVIDGLHGVAEVTGHAPARHQCIDNRLFSGLDGGFEQGHDLFIRNRLNAVA